MSDSSSTFQRWLDSLPQTDGFRHISAQRNYAHAEDQYDAQYGVVEDHPEEGQGLCALVKNQGLDCSGPALEVGCGTGYLTSGLAKFCPYPTLLVTDPSVAFLRITQKRLLGPDQKNPHLQFAVLNADDMHLLPVDTFSLIALRSTLHHILHVDAFIAACAGTLRPGGALIMSAEPCESGYVLMGAVAQSVPAVFQVAGVELRPEWARQLEVFTNTIKFYCRRDLDKSTAEDKHLFRVHELSRVGAQHGLRLDFFTNAVYENFVANVVPPLRPGYFTNFFLPYLRYCMSFDVEFVDLIGCHLKPQLDYLDECYVAHAGPVFNGVFVFTKTPQPPSR